MYAFTFNAQIYRSSDGAIIPVDLNNKDYQDFLAWRAAGNTPVVAPPDVSYIWSGAAWTQTAEAAKQEAFNTAVNTGYDTGLGWHLPLNDSARALITSGAALINAAITSFQLSSNTTGLTAFLASAYTFVDTTNTARSVTVQQALMINIGYGQYYQSIWATSQ